MLKMIDSFTLALIATVTLASLLPCQGEVAQAMNLITTLAIGLLFFLHGPSCHAKP
jgi:sodium/bile acid cotransporter 7